MTLPVEQGDHTNDGRRHGAVACGFLMIVLGLIAAVLPLFDLEPNSRVVGWLLFVAGLVELSFGVCRLRDKNGVTIFVSGLLTAAAGAIFVARPSVSYLPIANVVMLWLAVRGLWVLARTWFLRTPKAVPWLAVSGIIDVLLALILLVGFPVAVLVVGLFGPTPEMVARFSLIIAASLLFSGVPLVATARRPEV